MKIRRRTFLQLVGAAPAVHAFTQPAPAQSYPSRPVTIIVPFSAGGSSDVIARVVAEPLRVILGQPIIIENVGGADGSIGVGRAARAKPDGYVINFGAKDTHVLNGAFYTLTYDLLNDLVPVAPLVTAPAVLFGTKSMHANNLDELVAWLKANPNNASAGVVTLGMRLITMLFQRETNTRFALVPYRGGATRIQDLMAGQIDLLFGLPNYLPLNRGGSIKAFAVASDARLAVARDIPTFDEMGLPALSYSEWFGLFAPRGTPKEVIRRLNAAAVDALVNPVVRSRLADLGFEVVPREQQTPEALDALVKSDAGKWWPLVKELGIKVQ